MSKMILGILVAALFPIAAQAQTGKHVSVGASVGVQEYTDEHFRQDRGMISLLYRVSPSGHARDGWSLVPSATLDYDRAEFRPDLGGSNVRIGRLSSFPVLVGFGPQYRHGRTEVGLSIQAGASFNNFVVDQDGRNIYQGRLGTDLESIDPETSFAARSGAGVWYDLNSRLGLYGGAFYLYNRPSAPITAGGVRTTEKWNTDYVGFAVGTAVGLF